MTERLKSLYLLELKNQCAFALIAYDSVSLSLYKLNNNTDMRKTGDVMNCLWYHIQSFLISTANISKILWPINDTHKRGESLRNYLGISVQSPLESRTFRNHFEHFDERLSTWFTAYPHKNFIDMNVGQAGTFIGNIDKSDYIRHYDPVAQRLIFRGEEYDINIIVEAVRDLTKKLTV